MCKHEGSPGVGRDDAETEEKLDAGDNSLAEPDQYNLHQLCSENNTSDRSIIKWLDAKRILKHDAKYT